MKMTSPAYGLSKGAAADAIASATNATNDAVAMRAPAMDSGWRASVARLVTRPPLLHALQVRYQRIEVGGWQLVVLLRHRRFLRGLGLDRHVVRVRNPLSNVVGRELRADAIERVLLVAFAGDGMARGIHEQAKDASQNTSSLDEDKPDLEDIVCAFQAGSLFGVLVLVLRDELQAVLQRDVDEREDAAQRVIGLVSRGIEPIIPRTRRRELVERHIGFDKRAAAVERARGHRVIATRLHTPEYKQLRNDRIAGVKGKSVKRVLEEC
jgi:hypothetical protein